MTKGRKAKAAAATKARSLTWGIVALVAVAGVVAAIYLLRGDAGGVSSERVYVPVTDFGDVHGLAVDPGDPATVYVATHFGLMRGKDGAWERVGNIQDDYMGFSMHPTNGSTFWTSGHAKSGGNMGVRLSTDGGFNWDQIALDGVDFHGMTVSPADPSNLWGQYRSQLYRSTDGGYNWDVVNPTPPAIRSLVADPADPETVYATTQAGLSKSTDGGKSWGALAAIPATSFAITPSDPSVMYAGAQGSVSKSTDAGATWTRLSLSDPGTVGYLSVSPQDANVVYAATYQTAVYKSVDAGATWTPIKAPARS